MMHVTENDRQVTLNNGLGETIQVRRRQTHHEHHVGDAAVAEAIVHEVPEATQPSRSGYIPTLTGPDTQLVGRHAQHAHWR